MTGRLALAATLVVLGGCGGDDDAATTTGASAPAPAGIPPPPSASFHEAAVERGIDFRYVSGAGGDWFMPEIMGGGAALFDMDADGDLDAYLVQGGPLEPGDGERPPNRLFRNDGTGRFEDVTDGSGAGDRGYGNGVACGDYDGDGDVDLYVTNDGPCVLLANDGTGHFTDVTAAAGVGHDGWSTSAAFVDVDHDGDLDLFVCRYLDWSPAVALECFNTMGGPDYCSPRNYLAPAQDVLYRNDTTDEGVVFTDITTAAGLTAFSGTGLGVVCADCDGDGRVDIFVANDGMRDQLWINGADGVFEDKAVAMSCAFDRDGRAAAGMGVDAVDLDGDGFPEIMVSNLRNESDSLFVNKGGRFFANETTARGLGSVSRAFTRFGTGFYDFDCDGVLDLFQANGRVMRQQDVHGDDPYAETNLYFRGSVTGRFEEMAPRGGTVPPLFGASRAAAFGDVDGDGGVDVLIVNRDGPAHLLMNDVDHGTWIGLRVLDRHGAPALGARIELLVGNRRIVRTVRAAFSYQASSDPTEHVGLGAATGVTGGSVTWPDGTTRSLGALEAGRVHAVRP